MRVAGLNFNALQLIFLLLGIVAGCRSPLGGNQTLLIQDARGFVPVKVPKIPLLLPSDSLDPVYRGLHRYPLVKEFYRQSGYVPAWTDLQRPAADSLLQFIQNIRYHGLLPQNYHLAEIVSIDNGRLGTSRDLFRRDVLFTDAYLTLAQHLRWGCVNDPEKGADSLQIALLRKGFGEGAIMPGLRSQEPLSHGYRTLKEGLEMLLNAADPGERSLLVEGITLDTIPLHRKVRKMEINLERWKWEKAALGERHIFVNVPSFMIQVMVNDIPILESRAIVGKSQNQTPVFSSIVECFVTYPYWHVPRKISVEELLPLVQKDSSYLRRNHFDVLDRKGMLLHPDSIEWKKFSKNYFPVILRQREGSENSLGIIKFVFDNPYAVFLHDTNAPGLFRQKRRALSHGCIRMEKAIALAHFLVTGEIGKKSSRVENYLTRKLRHTVDLPEPIPIHVRYFTAEFRNGQVYLFDDIYEMDRKLADAMYPPAPGQYY